MPKQYMEMELQVPSGSPINKFGQIRSGLVGASGSEVKSLNPLDLNFTEVRSDHMPHHSAHQYVYIHLYSRVGRSIHNMKRNNKPKNTQNLN